MDFVTGLPISTDCKGDSYDPIIVIVGRLTNMVDYEPVKVTIDASKLAEVMTCWCDTTVFPIDC